MSLRTALITNPAHDIVTEYLHSWSEAILLDIKQNSTDLVILELNNDEVIKDNLTELITENNPNLVLFHGHGSSKVICGFDADVLISCDDNELLLKNKIIHSLTCDSGEILGPKCVSCGTLAFIGYKKEFKFAHYGEKTTSLQQADILAKLFLGPAFEIDIALLEGNSLEEAYKRSQEMYVNNLQVLITSSNKALAQTYASGLYHDMINQVVLGDLNASF